MNMEYSCIFHHKSIYDISCIDNVFGCPMCVEMISSQRASTLVPRKASVSSPSMSYTRYRAATMLICFLFWCVKHVENVYPGSVWVLIWFYLVTIVLLPCTACAYCAAILVYVPVCILRPCVVSVHVCPCVYVL